MSVSEIFWDEVFMVRNTVKTGQYLCSAVTFRKRSAFEIAFRNFKASKLGGLGAG